MKGESAERSCVNSLHYGHLCTKKQKRKIIENVDDSSSSKRNEIITEKSKTLVNLK